MMYKIKINSVIIYDNVRQLIKIYYILISFLIIESKRDIDSFFDTLKNAEIKEEEDKTRILDFKKPLSFSKLNIIKLNALMIRQCYEDLYKLIIPKTEVELLSNVVLVGNPGIGKSFFGVFLMYQLIKAKQTFVFQPTENVFYVHHGEQTKNKTSSSPRKSNTEVLTKTQFEKNYATIDKSIIHLFDGH